MTHPLFEGTRELARRFREERRGRSRPSSEEFLDAQRESPAYPAGIAREQWVALLDAMRNVREAEIDSQVSEWIEQLPVLDPTLVPSTLRLAEPLAADGERTVVSAQVPAEDARYIDRRYRIVRVLGEGAFGKVFLVQDKLQNEHELALKLIKKEHTATSEALVRFKNEILLLRVLNHPGIPQIFNDGISEDGEFYYTMAYVAGRTLDDVIRKEAPLDPLRIVRITKQIIDVLDYAHARGAIHRDLKPGNIFLLHAGTPKEQVRVLDFGIAKVLSREGILEHAQT
ncbi:MAG: serine/threonine-protein kinase, partial [Planctomycetota bacterium]